MVPFSHWEREMLIAEGNAEGLEKIHSTRSAMLNIFLSQIGLGRLIEPP